ncbi:MAG: hypothetical protein SFX72_10500 [Isosphaeraceae bacterium]|nr:hypothetical protein [Isosphaeraceae bacterium]
MDEMHRREVVRLALAGGLAAGLVDEPRAAADEPAPAPNPTAKTDRDFVIAAGMTEAEADCWAAAARAAGLFFALPELHPMDRQEVATAIHILQNKLLARPTYRKYLATAKAARGEG